jgi:hypothetical protein
MNTTQAPDGWYYKRNGQTVGPVSAGHLQGLLASGQLQPRQAVWRHRPQRLLFVPAEAAVGTEGGHTQAPAAERGQGCQ